MSRPGRQEFLKNQMPALFWAVLIFLASSIPGSAFPSMKIFQYDKMIHGTIFFFFGLFIYRAFNIFWSGISYSWARAFFTVVTVTIYGMLDEFHQHFVSGRTPDAWDATADTLGGVVAILLIYFLDKLKVNARSRI